MRSNLPKMYLGPKALSDLDRALRLEWLVTNGLGGYASSTVLGINTRKYHGLLVAAFNPPVDRHVLLSKIDEEVQIGGRNCQLGSNEFRGVIHPDGHTRLCGFTLSPTPTFTYWASGVYLKKTIFMPYMKNMVLLYYEGLNSLDEKALVKIQPLVNMRHFHETTDRHDKNLQFTQELIPNGILLESQTPEGHLAIIVEDSRYIPENALWIEKIYLRVDDSRGENCTDDNYQSGFFEVEIPPNRTKDFFVAAVGGRTKEEVTDESDSFDRSRAKKLMEEETARRERQLRNFYRKRPGMSREDWLDWLILAADSFTVRRRSTGNKTVIAGYHWFEDWGRDSLISLPGLSLVTQRFKDAEEILLTFKEYSRNGLVPNRFPDHAGDQPVYDSADATLWFFNSVLQYLKYTRKLDFVHSALWQTMQDIVEHHISGTSFGIRMDNDGLLLHGPRLTWMDVSVNGKPATPRGGKAVEIQALWYNALRIMEMLASRFGQGDDARRYSSIAETARASFNRMFWWPEGDYLYDVVNGGQRDSSLRPNQIIAASLDFCMLDNARREKTVDVVWRSLWGTYGLRTLTNNDPRYVGTYAGGFVQRDLAYHNGTVWAWLTGPLITAFLKAKGHREYWRRFAFERFLQPLFTEETYQAGLGTLSEIFDGDPPHSPDGCISQAWSVAEPLRAYVEDVLLIRPPYEKALGLGGSDS